METEGAKPMARVVHLFQVAFSTMSSTALVPMICYKHPNGQRSRLVGMHVDMWAGDRQENMLTVITKAAGRTLTFNKCIRHVVHIVRCANRCLENKYI